MTKAIVLGGSRGIGKAISNSLKLLEIDVFAASKKDIDTSNLDSVEKFLRIHNETDVLILNTGVQNQNHSQKLLKKIGTNITINYL